MTAAMGTQPWESADVGEGPWGGPRHLAEFVTGSHHRPRRRGHPVAVAVRIPASMSAQAVSSSSAAPKAIYELHCPSVGRQQAERPSPRIPAGAVSHEDSLSPDAWARRGLGPALAGGVGGHAPSQCAVSSGLA